MMKIEQSADVEKAAVKVVHDEPVPDGRGGETAAVTSWSGPLEQMARLTDTVSPVMSKGDRSAWADRLNEARKQRES
jgi:hypothetical protein